MKRKIKPTQLQRLVVWWNDVTNKPREIELVEPQEPDSTEDPQTAEPEALIPEEREVEAQPPEEQREQEAIVALMALGQESRHCNTREIGIQVGLGLLIPRTITVSRVAPPRLIALEHRMVDIPRQIGCTYWEPILQRLWLLDPLQVRLDLTMDTWRNMLNELAERSSSPDDLWGWPGFWPTDELRRLHNAQLALVACSRKSARGLRRHTIPSPEDIEKVEKWRSVLESLVVAKQVESLLQDFRVVIPAVRAFKKESEEAKRVRMTEPCHPDHISTRGKLIGLIGTYQLIQQPVRIGEMVANLSLTPSEAGSYHTPGGIQGPDLTARWAEGTPLGKAVAIRARRFGPHRSTLLLIEYRPRDLSSRQFSKAEELESIVLFCIIVKAVCEKYRKGQIAIVLAPPACRGYTSDCLLETNKWRIRAQFLRRISWLFNIPAYPMWTTGVTRANGQVILASRFSVDCKLHTRMGGLTSEHAERLFWHLKHLHWGLKPLQRDTTAVAKVWPSRSDGPSEPREPGEIIVIE
jgi:hypothetical protein